MNINWFAAAVIVLTIAPAPLYAQTTPMLKTNRPDVKAFPVPPPNFDALRATERELSTFGLPARPTNPEDLPMWEMIAGSGPHRIIPNFGTSKVKHTPAQLLRQNALANSSLTNQVIQSSNWSGIAIINTQEQNPLPFTNLYGSWIIPSGQIPPNDGCPANAPGNGYYSADWIGIDGAVNGNLVQTGTDTLVLCEGTTGVLATIPWWEWIPNAETPITNFAVNPGDGMFAVVSMVKPTLANIYLEDLTTGANVSFQVTAPAGAHVDGQSVEWIHEVPTIDGQVALLPAFGVSMFSIMWSNIPNLIRPLLPGSALTLQIDLVQNGGVVSTAWFAGNASAWIVGKNGEHLLFGN
jgi:hypothetical protein